MFNLNAELHVGHFSTILFLQQDFRHSLQNECPHKSVRGSIRTSVQMGQFKSNLLTAILIVSICSRRFQTSLKTGSRTTFRKSETKRSASTNSIKKIINFQRFEFFSNVIYNSARHLGIDLKQVLGSKFEMNDADRSFQNISKLS